MQVFDHAIGADAWLDDLTVDTKFDTSWEFLTKLKARGRRAADGWLTAGLPDVGVKSTADIRAEFL